MYEAKNFDHLLGLPGFSDTLLKNHFTLYQGYVTNTNKLATLAGEMLKTLEAASPVLSEMRRRFGWEFNGMRLHELYFENLSKQPEKMSAEMEKKLVTAFGSVEAWDKDFKAAAAMRGIGWVILYQDLATGGLFNVWINEHDVGHMAGCAPILIMDVFEHAFLTDYGLKRVDYIAAFMAAIDWKVVEKRLK